MICMRYTSIWQVARHVFSHQAKASIRHRHSFWAPFIISYFNHPYQICIKWAWSVHIHTSRFYPLLVKDSSICISEAIVTDEGSGRNHHHHINRSPPTSNYEPESVCGVGVCAASEIQACNHSELSTVSRTRVRAGCPSQWEPSFLWFWRCCSLGTCSQPASIQRRRIKRACPLVRFVLCLFVFVVQTFMMCVPLRMNCTSRSFFCIG